MNKMKRWLELFCVLLIVAGGAALFLIRSAKDSTTDEFTHLKTHIAPTEAVPTESEPMEEAGPVDTGNVKHFQEKFRALYDENRDFVGWLTVDDTDIDCCVVQRDDSFYLSHGFSQSYSRHGTPFLAAGCNAFSSEHLVIFGHNMRDGTIFSPLADFADPDFDPAAHTITFNTIWQDEQYRIIAVLRITEEEAQEFPYHAIFRFGADTMSRTDFLTRCRDYAVWMDDSAPVQDCRLLTLSTCEYSQENGRLVVVAASTGAQTE